MYSVDRLRCAGHGTLLSGGGGYRRAANHGNTAADGDASTYCHARTGGYAGNTGGTDPDRDGSTDRDRSADRDGDRTAPDGDRYTRD